MGCVDENNCAVVSTIGNGKFELFALLERLCDAIEDIKFDLKCPLDVDVLLAVDRWRRSDEFRSDSSVFIGFSSIGVLSILLATFLFKFSCNENHKK